MNYYDSISKGYDELYMEEQFKKFHNLRHLLPKKGLILDIGCGTGFITKQLENAIGIDYSIGMLKLCPKNLRLICADMANLPFKDNSFDCVFSLTALQDSKDVKKAIDEIKRVLKPNGKIILSVLNKNKIIEIKELIIKNFKKIKIMENQNDLAFFTQ